MPFFADVQRCYERWDPATPPNLRLEPADAIAAVCDEVDDSELFEPAVRRRYQQEVDYSTGEYLGLLNTYSGHLTLPAWRRRRLLACIADVLDGRYGSKITKRYLYELRVARRRPDPGGRPDGAR